MGFYLKVSCELEKCLQKIHIEHEVEENFGRKRATEAT